MLKENFFYFKINFSLLSAIFVIFNHSLFYGVFVAIIAQSRNLAVIQAIERSPN